MPFSPDDQQSGMTLCVSGGGDGCAPLEVHDVIPENEDAERFLLRRPALQEEGAKKHRTTRRGTKPTTKEREREKETEDKHLS